MIHVSFNIIFYFIRSFHTSLIIETYTVVQVTYSKYLNLLKLTSVLT